MASLLCRFLDANARCRRLGFPRDLGLEFWMFLPQLRTLNPQALEPLDPVRFNFIYELTIHAYGVKRANSYTIIGKWIVASF